MGRIQVNCTNCNAIIFRWNKDIKRLKHLFCSKNCFYEWVKKKPKGLKANHVICDICGKNFVRSPSGVDAHVFCSRRCFSIYMSEHMKRRIELKCPQCDKIFYRKKSRLKYKMAFCSKNCADYYRRGKPNNGRIRIENVCEQCHKIFLTRPCQKRRFCSKACSYIWLRNTRKGKNNPNYKLKKYMRCEICNKVFPHYPSQKKRRFCSWECWLIYLKSIRKISDENRAKMLNNLLKRPNIPELILIEIINLYKFPFKYVGNGDIIINGLNPDFICYENKLIIEVFGDYWHNPNHCRITAKEKIRKIIYSKAGYKLMIIWEHELKKRDYDEISQKIQDFCKI